MSCILCTNFESILFLALRGIIQFSILVYQYSGAQSFYTISPLFVSTKHFISHKTEKLSYILVLIPILIVLLSIRTSNSKQSR